MEPALARIVAIGLTVLSLAGIIAASFLTFTGNPSGEIAGIAATSAGALGAFLAGVSAKTPPSPMPSPSELPSPPARRLDEPS